MFRGEKTISFYIIIYMSKLIWYSKYDDYDYDCDYDYIDYMFPYIISFKFYSFFFYIYWIMISFLM